MAGTLYIVSTPIGNATDLTVRAVRVLQRVAAIAAEDPRHSAVLCRRHRITTPLTSYHNDNKEEKTPVLLDRLRQGEDVALVSDGGTPVVCDPGRYLIGHAAEAGLTVVPVPGPSAALAALTVSGFSGDAFAVLGPLPRSAAARRRRLSAFVTDPCTLVLLEHARRIPALLPELARMLGDRHSVLAMELTTPRERLIRGSLGTISQHLRQEDGWKEMTLVIQGGRAKRTRGKARRPL